MYDVRHMMWKITQETKKIVWDQLVDKVNKFFTKEVCLCDNLCPKPIEKKEVYWVYSFGCFGTSEDGKRQCTLPCHAYGDGYDWCPIFVRHRLPQNNLLNGHWDYCKKDQGLLKCMPVKGTTIFDRKWVASLSLLLYLLKKQCTTMLLQLLTLIVYIFLMLHKIILGHSVTDSFY